MLTRSLKPRTEIDRLVIENLSKVHFESSYFAALTGLPYNEFYSYGCEKLVYILQRWDPTLGANPSTWVNRNLRFYFYNYLRDNSRLVRLPRKMLRLGLKLQKLRQQYPGIANCELASLAGCTPAEVAEVEQALQPIHSLDMVYHDNDV